MKQLGAGPRSGVPSKGREGPHGKTVTTHAVYDPATNTWSEAAPMPTPRSSVASTIYRGMIVVVGGELAPDTFVEAEGYDLKTGRWLSFSPLPHGRHGFGGGTI